MNETRARFDQMFSSGIYAFGIYGETMRLVNVYIRIGSYNIRGMKSLRIIFISILDDKRHVVKL